MEDKLIYETENFRVLVPFKPHVTRADGGHIFIREKNKHTVNRYEMLPEEIVELSRLITIVGEAYEKAMNSRGVAVKRINYQDNGNWAYLRGEIPFMHVHIYGRCENSEKQKWGEALYFPNPFTDYYRDIEPINNEDIKEIRAQIELLNNDNKYNTSKWKIS